MNLQKFTEKAQQAVVDSQQTASRFGHQAVDVEHLLLSLLQQDGGLIPHLLQKAGIQPETAIAKTEAELRKLPSVSGTAAAPDGLYVIQRLNNLLTKSQDTAKKMKDDFVSVEHLILPMFDESTVTGVAKIFKELGLTRDRFMAALAEVRGHQRVTNQTPEGTYEALEKYGRDLTQLARTQKLDPVIGRDTEIRRSIQVLSRRTKNIPCSLVSPALEKPRLSKVWPSALWPGMCPTVSRTKKSSLWTWARSLPEPNTAANLRNA